MIRDLGPSGDRSPVQGPRAAMLDRPLDPTLKSRHSWLPPPALSGGVVVELANDM